MNGAQFTRANGSMGKRIDEQHISLLVYELGSTTIPLTKCTSLADFEATGTYLPTEPMLYHVSEFYRMSPGATLWVYSSENQIPISELRDAIEQTNSDVRQIGVICDGALVANNAPSTLGLNRVADISQMLDEMYTNSGVGISALLQFPVDAGTGVFLPNLRALSYPRISICIGEDASGWAAYIKDQGPLSDGQVGMIGTALGIMSACAANETIFEVAKRNLVPQYRTNSLATGLEFDSFLVAGEANLSQPAIATLDGKGYVFPRMYVSTAGVFLNDSHAACPLTDDAAYIESNRLSDAVDRIIYAYLVRKIGGNIGTDPATGYITETSAALMEADISTAISAELSGAFSAVRISIPRNQQPLVTSIVIVERELVPNGIMRKFNVNSRTVVSLS